MNEIRIVYFKDSEMQKAIELKNKCKDAEICGRYGDEREQLFYLLAGFECYLQGHLINVVEYPIVVIIYEE